MSPPHRRGLLALIVVAVGSVVTCMPDEAAFKGRTFYCSASDPKPGCGKTDEGTALTCYGGKQLGAGKDFCVEDCSSAPVSSGSDSICVASKAKLRVCRPSVKTADDPDGCGPELACFRTDLFRDEGVCLAVRVCSVDADCTDPALSTCAATVVKAIFPKAGFLTDNLQCVVGGCKAKGTSCPLGETCLPLVVPSSTPVPDICVPSCDSNLDCPPNYACWSRLSGPSSPNVCIPTLAAARCSSSIDCMVGECQQMEEGLSLCNVPCESHADCARVTDSGRPAYCVAPKADQPEKRYCIGVSPYNGAFCLADSNCPAPQKCFFTSVYTGKMSLGECRLPCGAEDRCPVRGGYPHACFLSGDAGSCYPGRFGVTCQRSEDCLSGNSCQEVPPEQRLGPTAVSSRICTRACATDVDCINQWDKQEGYCEAGWCRLGEGAGGPCTRDQQCGRGRCERADSASAGNCVYPPATISTTQ